MVVGFLQLLYNGVLVQVCIHVATHMESDGGVRVFSGTVGTVDSLGGEEAGKGGIFWLGMIGVSDSKVGCVGVSTIGLMGEKRVLLSTFKDVFGVMSSSGRKSKFDRAC